MKPRLIAAGVREARGFSVNVSNFVQTDRSAAFARDLAGRIGGGVKAVIDTGRNGNGPGSDPCNPPGRALGAAPTTRTGDPVVDALLWIKPPGPVRRHLQRRPGGRRVLGRLRPRARAQRVVARRGRCG